MDYSAVEALVRERRWKEALAELSRLSRRGGGSRAAYFYLGQVYEGLGRKEESLKMLLKADGVEPDSAEASLRLSAYLLAAGDPRGARPHARRALALKPGHLRARLLLIQSLAEAGELPEAADRLRGLLRGPGEAPERALAGAIERLIKSGGYGLVAEDALAYARSCAGDGAWIKCLCRLIAAGRYAEAAELGETLLDGLVRRAAPHEFLMLLWPWSPQIRRSLGEADFSRAQLARVDSLLKGTRPSPWLLYCRGVLLDILGRGDESAGEFEKIRALPPARYFWMRLPFALALLLRKDFARASREFRLVLKRRPDFWWARCRLAEALLAQGDESGALRELRFAHALAARAGDEKSRREILVWHGEMLLWTGRYSEALSKLEEAAGLKAYVFVDCWRGAAYLKLGRLPEALACLDRAVERDPKDAEALTWRGEAKRLLGRHREALADLDLALERNASMYWALVNRALAKGALGDEKGLLEDFARLPKDVAARLGGKTGARRPGPEGRREQLERGLESAKGVRRWEDYVSALWMKE